MLILRKKRDAGFYECGERDRITQDCGIDTRLVHVGLLRFL